MTTEEYIVKFNYFDGAFWKFGITETVTLRVPDHNIKTNHEMASEIIKNKYPNCEIVKVKYV